jgi:transcriptional regulator with XRE-family HTH domain
MSRESALGLSEVFGQQVRKARRIRDWSQQDLADAISNVAGSPEGYPMKQANIAKIEGGQRKRLVLEDVLLFAAALEVYPNYLLAPLEDDQVVDFGIGAVTAVNLRGWFEGARWFRDDPPPSFLNEFRPNSSHRYTEEVAAVSAKMMVETIKTMAEILKDRRGVDTGILETLKGQAESFERALPEWIDEAMERFDAGEKS